MDTILASLVSRSTADRRICEKIIAPPLSTALVARGRENLVCSKTSECVAHDLENVCA